MKARYAIVLITAFLLISGPALMAESEMYPTIRANVPFAFRVGNTQMPAGQYRVAHIGQRDMLLIWGVENKTVSVRHSIRSDKYADATAKLVFNRYNETYFLREVWIPGTSTNQLDRSRAEQEYAERWSSPESTTVVALVTK